MLFIFMLNLLNKGKAGKNFTFENINIGWHEAINTSEDFLTSNFFERLFYLPQEVIWKILAGSFVDPTSAFEYSEILTYEFWPPWKIENKVEPDLFIRCKNIDIIVEVKAWDGNNSQCSTQWERQLIAYNMVYGTECKNVLILAIGGNKRLDTNNETIEVNGRKATVFKIKWTSLLTSLVRTKSFFESQDVGCFNAANNILSDMIAYLNYHGYSAGELFDKFDAPYKISPKSLDSFTKFRTGMMNRLVPNFTISSRSSVTFSKYLNKPMEMSEFKNALIDVRKAYRLLYIYQRRVIDTVDYIATVIGINIENTYSCFSGSTFDGRKYNRENWAWDWLPMYFHEYYCGEKKLMDSSTIKIGIAIQSDTGFFDAPISNQRNIEAFGPVEESESRLLFYISRNCWKSDFPDFEQLFMQSNQKVILGAGIKQLTAIGLPLSNFMNETLISESLMTIEEYFNNNGFPEFKIGEGIMMKRK